MRYAIGVKDGLNTYVKYPWGAKKKFRKIGKSSRESSLKKTVICKIIFPNEAPPPPSSRVKYMVSCRVKTL